MKVFYLPTDAREKRFKTNIIIYLKTAATCFGLNHQGAYYLSFAKVISLKIIS
jgi:hypothetical protein